MEDRIMDLAPALCPNCTDAGLCEKHAAAARAIDAMMSNKLAQSLDTVNYSETSNIIPMRRPGFKPSSRAAFLQQMKNTSTTNRVTGEPYTVPEMPRAGSTWRCETCKCMVNAIDTSGFTVDRAGRGGLEPCPTCTPAVARAKAYKQTARHISQLVLDRKIFNEKNLPFNAHKLTLAAYPKHGDQKAKSKVQDFITGNIENLFLTGDVGRGKTGLSIAAANALALQGKQVFLLSVADYITLLKANFEKDAKENHIKEIIKDVEILFFDDLGAEGATEFTLKEIQEIIEYRNAAGLRTLITSNFNLKGLTAYWHLPVYENTGFQPAARTISRLKGWYQVVTFNGPELR